MRIPSLALATLLTLGFEAYQPAVAHSQQRSDRPTSSLIQGLSQLEVFRGIPAGEVQAWVDSVYQRLDERARLAQLIMPIIYPRPEDTSLLIERLKKEQWGGILFQKGLLADQRTLTTKLQAASRVPLLITLDGEWGLYMRLKDAPRYPRNKGLGDKQDLQLLEAYGTEVARQCRLMGIHVNFAPVVDVNSNPKNPVIGTRSFGSTPERVISSAVAYGRGLERGGVLSVAKHFPGHGDTSEDSHKTLPTVSASKERMQKLELAPFRGYFRAGLGGIMTAHLRVPAYDPSGTPASLSPAITRELLRGDLDFRGLVFTDALEMRGAQVSPGQSVAVEALRAGNDVLLGPSHPQQALEELLQAKRQGLITESQVEQHCKRLLAFKYALIIRKAQSDASAEDIKRRIWTPQEAALRQRLWQASGTAEPNSDPTARTQAIKLQRPTPRK